VAAGTTGPSTVITLLEFTEIDLQAILAFGPTENQAHIGLNSDTYTVVATLASLPTFSTKQVIAPGKTAPDGLTVSSTFKLNIIGDNCQYSTIKTNPVWDEIYEGAPSPTINFLMTKDAMAK